MNGRSSVGLTVVACLGAAFFGCGTPDNVAIPCATDAIHSAVGATGFCINLPQASQSDVNRSSPGIVSIHFGPSLSSQSESRPDVTIQEMPTIADAARYVKTNGPSNAEVMVEGSRPGGGYYRVLKKSTAGSSYVSYQVHYAVAGPKSTLVCVASAFAHAVTIVPLLRDACRSLHAD